MDADQTTKRIVMIVPGLHWDLQWQQPMWLTSNIFQSVISNGISRLEHDSKLKLSLDGQSVLALLYMSNVSHQESRSRYNRQRKLVRRGQLEIGPALVILDEFLAPEMALLQNLLIGREVTETFGGKLPPVFDMSDGFGHVAQMAQVMAPFARYLFISRGLTAKDMQHVMFILQSPDGSRVIAVPQQGGYQSGREFGRTSETASLQSFDSFMQQYGPRYGSSDPVLYYARKDYGGLPEFMMEHLEALRRAHPQIQFLIGTNADYAALLDKLDQSHLDIRTGDLSGSGDKFVLRGVSSMRMALKLRNAWTYEQIRSAQTAASLAILARGKSYYYPRHDMTRIWSDFLVQQSHDSITGCHSDQVFLDSMAKLQWLGEEAGWIKTKALAALAGRSVKPNHDNRVGRAPTSHFSLVNLLPYVRDEVAIVPLPPRLKGNRKLRAYAGDSPDEIPVQRVGTNRAAFRIAVGSFGSASFKLQQNTHSDVSGVSAPAGTIENWFLRAEVGSNGTIVLTDKITGRRYEGLHYFESIGDAGDTYTFAPVEDRPYVSFDEPATVTAVCQGPLVWEMEITTVLHLPGRLDRRTRTRRLETVAVPVHTLLRLRAGSRQLEFETTVTNRASDHRLRVVFPVGETVKSSRAQTAFMVQEYPIRPPLDPDWKEYSTDQEPPFNAITNQGLVIAGTLYSANIGVTEYEARNTADGTELCLTLERCTGLLSQEGDLSTRRGQAGPGQVHVPLAQNHGQLTFHYTLGLVSDSTDVELAQSAQCWRSGFEPSFAGTDSNGLLEVDAGQSVFSALMPAPDSKSVTLYHWAGNAPATLGVTGHFKSIRRLRLDRSPSPKADTQLDHHEIGSFDLG